MVAAVSRQASRATTVVGNNNLAEHFRLAGEQWVAEDSAARLLEETKQIVFSQYVKEQGDMPVSRAEHNVRSSEKWHEFIVKMVEQRSKANAAKIELRFREMRFYEMQSNEATARAERRL